MERAQQSIPQEILDAEKRMHSRRLSEKIGPMITKLNERSHSAYVFADRQVHAHPWGAVGGALGLGVALGALVALAARRH